jgi:predicted XRE-type DNA-binding protein
MSETITIEQGSDNVFADLGYPNAEGVLTKARLAQRITEVLEKKRLMQIQAAQLLGIDQPRATCTWM